MARSNIPSPSAIFLIMLNTNLEFWRITLFGQRKFMPLPPDEAWFRARRYGYGWGLPRRLQGWLVLLVYFPALYGGIPLGYKDRPSFMVYASALTAGLILICFWKGESPRWCWRGSGKKEEPNQPPRPPRPFGPRG
jgi:hypothetical protein